MAYYQQPANWTAMSKNKGFDPASIAFKPQGGSGAVNGPKTQPQQSPWNWNPAAMNGGATPPSWMAGALSHMLPQIISSLNFSNTLEPARQAEINRILQTLSPANAQRNIDTVARQAYKQNMKGYARAKSEAGSRGLSEAFIKAMGLDAQNQANTTAGNFAAYQMSPEGQAASSAAIMNAIAGGMLPPALQLALGLQSGHQSALATEYGKPKEQNGFGGMLGGLLGSAVGGLNWNKIFGL